MDGVSRASVSWGGTPGGFSATIYIGVAEDSTSYLNGYLNDFRVTAGVARYPAAFTPPAASYPDVLETLSQQNAMIYDHLTPV